MKHRLFILSVLVLLAWCSNAQAQDVKSAIRQHYADAKAYIEVLVKRRPIEGGNFTTIYQGKALPEAYKGYYESRLSASKDIMQTFKAINAGREL